MYNLLIFILYKKYKLPYEIVMIIIYNFLSLQHPISKLLIDKTKNYLYECQMFSNKNIKIQKYYKNNGIDNYLLNLTHNQDPGFYIPRKFGKLYYQIIKEKNKIQNGMSLSQWNLKSQYCCINCDDCGCFWCTH